MKLAIKLYWLLILFVVKSNAIAEQSIPPKIDGPINTAEQALSAVRYLTARESSLMPCGVSAESVKKVGNEWLIFNTVEGFISKPVSWRVWQIDALTGELVNVTSHNWKFNRSECKNA